MGCKADPARVAFVYERLTEGATEAQIVAEGVERFQVKGRIMRRTIRLCLEGMRGAEEGTDLATLRARHLHTLGMVVNKCLIHDPPHLKTALAALDQISRIRGFDAPVKLQSVVAGLDLGGDGVITVSAIRERLREMRQERRLIDEPREEDDDPSTPN
jgi:hypothetical protein